MFRRSFVVLSLVAALAASVSVTGAQDVRLDPNTASAEQLATVRGLDPALAQQILAGRPFPTMIEFDALVRGALAEGEALKLYEQLFVLINLNNASEAEIALIPGMSNRMVHEFLEYRPYSDISVFDREIGKYVDDTEVARLRSYVTL